MPRPRIGIAIEQTVRVGGERVGGVGDRWDYGFGWIVGGRRYEIAIAFEHPMG